MTTSGNQASIQPDPLARTFFIITMIAAFMFYGVVVLLTKVLPGEGADEAPAPAGSVP